MPTHEPTREPGITKVVGRYTTSYRVTLDIGPDPVSGKRRQKTRSFPTYREALDWKTATKHRVRERSYLEPSEEPLSEYLTRWLDTLSRPRPSSIARYRLYLDKQIGPHLGAVELGALTPERLDAWTAALARQGLSPHTIHDAFALLRSALNAAVRWRLILVNPALAASVPHVPKRPATIWDAAQVRRFLSFTAADPLAPAWQLAALLGARRGEILALGWQDVDLERATARITRSLTREGNRWALGEPKTEASRRLLPLPAQLVGSLRIHHYRQAEQRDLIGPEWNALGLVFPGAGGGPLDPAAFGQRFHQLADAAGLPRIRPHDLRHSAASSMLHELRLPLIVVSRILGHSQIATTADIYGHTEEAALRDAVRQIEGYFPAPGESA